MVRKNKVRQDEAARRVLACLDVRLLELGGEDVFHPIEIFGGHWIWTTVPVLEGARPFSGNACQWYGARSACHANAAALWKADWGNSSRAGRALTRIHVGIALMTMPIVLVASRPRRPVRDDRMPHAVSA